MTNPLREKLLAAVAFDPGIDMRYDEENDRVYTYHARTREIVLRLIDCAVACEGVGEWAKAQHMLAGPLAQAHNAALALTDAMGGGE